MRSDVLVARLTWSLRPALVTMEKADIDRLPVVQDDGGFVGIGSTADLFKLDEILEQMGDARGRLTIVFGAGPTGYADSSAHSSALCAWELLGLLDVNHFNE